MAGGGRVPRPRISWVRRHRRASKLGGRGGHKGDLVLKTGNRSCGEWICVRGHRIRLEGRMRVDTNGNVYVPDSEDEEPGMEVEAGDVEVADLEGTAVAGDGVDVEAEGGEADGVKVAADAASGDEMHPEGDGVGVKAEGGDADGVKVAADAASGDKMHPEVVARLNMVLACIDPAFRDIFVDMLKVLVPAFFDP
ncbi:unnamed protein product [Urochloa humidicola]